MHDKVHGPSVRVRLPPKSMEAIRKAWELFPGLPAGSRCGVTYVDGSREFLLWCADVLAARIEYLRVQGGREIFGNYHGLRNTANMYAGLNRFRMYRLELARQKLLTIARTC